MKLADCRRFRDSTPWGGPARYQPKRALPLKLNGLFSKKCLTPRMCSLLYPQPHSLFRPLRADNKNPVDFQLNRPHIPIMTEQNTASASETPVFTAEEHVKAALDAAVDEVHSTLSAEGQETESEFDIGLAAVRKFLSHLETAAEGEVKAAAERLKTHLEAVL